MIPSYILSEIALRLHEQQRRAIERIAKAVGIDLSAALEPLPSLEEEAPPLFPRKPRKAEVIRGAVPFEIKLSVLGHEATQTCRAVFSAWLADSVDRRTGEPLKVIGEVQIDWQLLDWRDLDHLNEETGQHLRARVPTWTNEFDALLPSAVEMMILDQIEERARVLERNRQISTA